MAAHPTGKIDAYDKKKRAGTFTTGAKRVYRSRSSGLGPHIGYNDTTCRRSNHSQYSFALCVGVWWNPSMQVLRYLKVDKSYLFNSANSHIQKDRRQLSVRGLGLAPNNRL